MKGNPCRRCASWYPSDNAKDCLGPLGKELLTTINADYAEVVAHGRSFLINRYSSGLGRLFIGRTFKNHMGVWFAPRGCNVVKRWLEHPDHRQFRLDSEWPSTRHNPVYVDGWDNQRGRVVFTPSLVVGRTIEVAMSIVPMAEAL